MNEKVSVAEVKSRFSEFLSRVAHSHKRIVITKRNKPIAALVDLSILYKAESMEECEGLASVMGKWKDFDEISLNIDKVYNSRKKDKARNVSI